MKHRISTFLSPEAIIKTKCSNASLNDFSYLRLGAQGLTREIDKIWKKLFIFVAAKMWCLPIVSYGFTLHDKVTLQKKCCKILRTL